MIELRARRPWIRFGEAEEAVVLIHGLFMSGREMALLRRRLAIAGFSTRQFSYPSVRVSPAVAARLLGDFVADIEAPVVHYVAHSLGGLILRHFFHGDSDGRPGRVVTLATPHQGSRAAQAVAQTALGRRLLGQSIEQGLLGDVPVWRGERAVGVIAGSRGIGLGRFLAPLDRPHDGTVAAVETSCVAAADQIVLPVSHFGGLISREVAEQVIYFLRRGRFRRGARAMGVDDTVIERISVEDLQTDKSGSKWPPWPIGPSESRLGMTTSKGRVCISASVPI